MTKRIKHTAAALLLAAAPLSTAQAQDVPQVSPEQVQQLVETLRQRNEQLRTLNARVQAAEAEAAEGRQLRTRLAAAEKALGVAAQKNRELVEIGEAILDDYAKMDLGKRAGGAEPLTQLYRVRLENKLQAFHDQLAAQGFYPEREIEAVKAGPATAPAPAAQ